MPPPGELSRARVSRQVVNVRGRPDIVVTVPALSLVIELKINAPEGWQQTARQADDYAEDPQALLVYLTRDGQPPGDSRFLPVSLRHFADDLTRVLAAAPEPVSLTAARGRAVAADYLSTLRRMFQMDPADQIAARVWLTYGKSVMEAKEGCQKLLAELPGRSYTALKDLAPGFGQDFTALLPFRTVSKNKDKEYPEYAALLARRRWLQRDGTPRLGIGLGQSERPDPDDSYYKPFYGVYAPDRTVSTRLQEIWADRKAWGDWARWEYLPLDPPAGEEDLLSYYATTAAKLIKRLWLQHGGAVDEVMGTATD